jgi:hypothetical protein
MTADALTLGCLRGLCRVQRDSTGSHGDGTPQKNSPTRALRTLGTSHWSTFLE